jgi:hypothetical protein
MKNVHSVASGDHEQEYDYEHDYGYEYEKVIPEDRNTISGVPAFGSPHKGLGSQNAFPRLSKLRPLQQPTPTR